MTCELCGYPTPPCPGCRAVSDAEEGLPHRPLAIDAETFDRLIDEGRELRREFDADTRGMRLLTAADLGRRCR